MSNDFVEFMKNLLYNDYEKPFLIIERG